MNIYIHIYTYMHTHTYTYSYINIYLYIYITGLYGNAWVRSVSDASICHSMALLWGTVCLTHLHFGYIHLEYIQNIDIHI